MQSVLPPFMRKEQTRSMSLFGSDCSGSVALSGNSNSTGWPFGMVLDCSGGIVVDGEKNVAKVKRCSGRLSPPPSEQNQKQTLIMPSVFYQDPTLPQGYSISFRDRFWKKVDKNGPIPAHRPELGPCWIWTGWICSGTGYGGIQAGHKGMLITAPR